MTIEKVYLECNCCQDGYYPFDEESGVEYLFDDIKFSNPITDEETTIFLTMSCEPLDPKWLKSEYKISQPFEYACYLWLTNKRFIFSEKELPLFNLQAAYEFLLKHKDSIDEKKYQREFEDWLNELEHRYLNERR